MTEPIVDAVIHTDGDTVKYVGMVLAATVALIVAWLTQSRIKSREKDSHRRGKYEEIVTDINELIFKLIERNKLNQIPVMGVDTKELSLEVAARAHKLDMLLSIYAPYITVVADKNNPHSNKVIDLIAMYDADIELINIKNTILTKARELT